MKGKTRRKPLIVTGIIAVLCLIAFCSCRNDMKAKAEHLLQEKYGETFTAKEINKMNGLNFVWLFPESDESMTVEAIMNKDGSTIDDDYAVKKVCHKISAQYEDALNEIPDNPCNYTVCTENQMVVVDEDDLDLTPAEYLAKHEKDNFDIAIFVETDGKADNMVEINERAEAVKAKLPSGCTVTLYGVTKRTFKKINEEIASYDEVTEKAERLALSGK